MLFENSILISRKFFKHMKHILLIFSFSLLVTTEISAQYEFRGDEYYSYDEELSLYLEADSKSRESGKKEKYVYRLLKVFDNTDGKRVLRDSVALSNECSSGYSYNFGQIYDSYSKKFILISGRFCFYLYDIKNKKLLGSFKPYFWGLTKENESGLIKDIKISSDGNLIYGILIGSGAFLFNVCDLQNIKEYISANLPFFSTGRVYEATECGNSNKYNVICINKSEETSRFNELLSSININPITNHNLLELTEEEIEELVLKTSLTENRYIIIEQYITQDKIKFVVIDIIRGGIIPLPENKNLDSAEKIREYLKK